MSAPAALDVTGLAVAYDGVDAVLDLDLALPAGEVLAVLGPSGCGKSTLLRAVAGLEAPYAGTVRLDGDDVTGVPTHRRGCALMFQDRQLFSHFDVAANVAYPLRRRRPRPTRVEVDARVGELLELVGLDGYAARLPATLSGGEQQRVALARALAVRPRLLLLDEPLSALDAALRGRLAADLRRILTEAGITALMVTHDQEEAFAVADRLALMRRGRLVQEGPVADVWRAPVDGEAARFLGYARVLDGSAVDVVLRAAGAGTGPGTGSGAGPGSGARLALRRSALRVDAAGLLTGSVVSVAASPEEVRLVVDVDDAGHLDAVAASGDVPGPGAAVRLTVDPTRLAVLG